MCLSLRGICFNIFCFMILLFTKNRKGESLFIVCVNNVWFVKWAKVILD